MDWKIELKKTEDDIIEKVQDCVYGMNINVKGEEYKEILNNIKNSIWLRGEIQRAVENLLEQERKLMSDEISKNKVYDDCDTHRTPVNWHGFNDGLDVALSIINKK